MFNLAIDSKIRGCDVVALKVEDVAPKGYTIDRATVRQKKTGQPVRFELTEQTRQAVDDYLRGGCKKPGDFIQWAVGFSATTTTSITPTILKPISSLRRTSAAKATLRPTSSFLFFR